jgi:flagellar motility protein MotE (MotC chaperone)
MNRPRFARLLPGVVLVSAAVLALNTSGLVHDAYALANTAASGATNALTAAPAPGNKDYAGGDDEVASAAQADVLTSLSRRRGELDARQARIKMQADILAATETRMDTKIAQLKTLQDQIAKLLAQRDDAQKAQLASLVKTYSAMKAKDTARIFDSLSDEVLVPVAQQMKSDVLAPVLAAMNPDAAQKLTIKLADRLTLPATTDALKPVAAPAAAASLPAATPVAATPAATPAAAPAQTASAAPAAAPATAPKPKS